VLREDARTSRDAECPTYCYPASIDDDARFRAYTVATDVALGVGVLAVVGGAAWYLLGRAPARRAAGIGVGTIAVSF
jgi:hypothetical protein